MAAAPPLSAELFDCLALQPLDEATAFTVLSQLLSLVRSRDAYALIRPEQLTIEKDTVAIRDDTLGGGASASNAATAGAFLPPECRGTLDFSRITDSQAAYAWNLGMLFYTLLAGFPPFTSTVEAVCPFFADFVRTHGLACPQHFSSTAIDALVMMTSLAPEKRIRLGELSAACDKALISLPRWAAGVGAAAGCGDGATNASPTHLRLTAGKQRASSVSGRLAALAIKPFSPRGGKQPSLPSASADDCPREKVSSVASAAAGATAGGAAATAPEQPLRSSADDTVLAAATAAAAVNTHDDDDDGDGYDPEPGAQSSDSSREPSVQGSPLIAQLLRDDRLPGAPAAGARSGPHGATSDVVQKSMVPHPNSPSMLGDVARGAGRGSRPERPVAVMYSPASGLSRKVASGASAATRGALLTAAAQPPSRAASDVLAACGVPRKRSKGPGWVKRLGWYVDCADPAYVSGAIQSVLDKMMVPAEPVAETTLANASAEGGVLGITGFVTAPMHVDPGMGHGEMRATILIAALDAPGGASSINRIRIDVMRSEGDTFQFHAFYRRLRDEVANAIGHLLTASPMVTKRSPLANDSTAPGAFADGKPLGGTRAIPTQHATLSPRSMAAAMSAALSAPRAAISGWSKRAAPRQSRRSKEDIGNGSSSDADAAAVPLS